MPRSLRIWFPGALYHLIVRGDNREPIFFGERDYLKYLKLLKDAIRRYDCQLFAYALMTNHVHLMVQTGQTHPVAKLMQSLNTAYTMYVNKQYKRVGHIFQGRYHSVLVEKDSYALELTRYIHLNPVRAGLARTPERYRWSSYRAYRDREDRGLVETDQILGMISQDEAQQGTLYRQFVLEGLIMRRTLERELLASTILGSPDFISMVKEGAKPLARKPAFPELGV